MQASRILTYKDMLLKRQTIADGSIFSERLTGEGLITDLYIRFDVAHTIGTGVVATLDGVLRAITRISCEVDSEQLFNLNPAEQHHLMNILDGTRPSFTQLASGVNGVFVLHIPLALPRPYGHPLRLATAMPAGLINNFVIRIEAAPDFEDAVYSSVGTGDVTSVTFSIVAKTAIMSRDELKAHVRRSRGLALFQDSVDQPVATATEQELRFKSGRGVLTGFFVRNAIDGDLDSTASNAAATTTRLVIGASDFVVDSRFLELQDQSKSRFQVETMPTGAYFHTLAPHGDLAEGVPLSGVHDVRLLQTFAGTPDDAFQHTISHILLPGFYDRYA